MDQTAFFINLKMDNFNAKLSPVTSVGTQDQINDQLFIQDGIEIIQESNKCEKFSNTLYLKKMEAQHNIKSKQHLFQHIQEEIMMYFERKGVEAGNPGDFKKQFNKKLHKRVSMMIEVSQTVTLKANAGSSLLGRRLQKKMVVTL